MDLFVVYYCCRLSQSSPRCHVTSSQCGAQNTTRKSLSVSTNQRLQHNSPSPRPIAGQLTPRYSLDETTTSLPPVSTSKQAQGSQQFSRCVLQTTVGGLGRCLGQFDNCAAAITLSNGNIAAVDTNNQRIQLLSNGLDPLLEVGKGRLVDPCGITTVRNDRFCVSEGSKKRITIFSNDGDYIGKFYVHHLEEPCCLATCSLTGNIIITDYLSADICVYDAEGSLQYKFQTELTDELADVRPIPEAIATDKAGRIYISFGASASQIQVFSSSGQFLFRFGNFTAACGLHITSRNNVIVVDREERMVSRFTTSGEFVQHLVTPSNGLTMHPRDVTVVGGASLVVTSAESVLADPTWLQLYRLTF